MTPPMKYLTETFFQKVKRIQDLKYMSWVTEIHIVFQLIRKIVSCIGVKLARMPMPTAWIQEVPADTTKSTRPVKQAILDGPCLLVITMPITITIMKLVKAATLMILLTRLI